VVSGASALISTAACASASAKAAPTWLVGSVAMGVSPRQLSIDKNVALMPRSSRRRYHAGAHGLGASVFKLRSSRDSTLCACTGNGGYER